MPLSPTVDPRALVCLPLRGVVRLELHGAVAVRLPVRDITHVRPVLQVQALLMLHHLGGVCLPAKVMPSHTSVILKGSNITSVKINLRVSLFSRLASGNRPPNTTVLVRLTDVY